MVSSAIPGHDIVEYLICKLQRHFNTFNRLGVTSIDELEQKIQDYEKQGFAYESNGISTPNKGYLTKTEIDMILKRPLTGNRRHIEALRAFEYLEMKVFYEEIREPAEDQEDESCDINIGGLRFEHEVYRNLPTPS